ncbi:hypothetical protein K3495_g15541 [Podosphaera aphanis]|nr:hypothetical protein K3495_g15541 [Podosphaera aphanis]
MLTNLKEKTVYHPSESLEDPLLIRDDNTLEILDESSIQGFNSIRHLHQLADPSQETINWDILPQNNNSPESTEIVQDFAIPSSNSSELSSIIDLDSIENIDIDEQTTNTNSAQANEISSHIDEANILPDNEKRSRKAPRRNIYALASDYETFHLAMAAIVSNPVIIGRRLPFVSTMKPPPNTWKQMIRHSELDGFRKAAKIEWNTLIEKETLEMISIDQASQLEEQHQIKSLPLKWVFTYKQEE